MKVQMNQLVIIILIIFKIEILLSNKATIHFNLIHDLSFNVLNIWFFEKTFYKLIYNQLSSITFLILVYKTLIDLMQLCVVSFSFTN